MFDVLLLLGVVNGFYHPMTFDYVIFWKLHMASNNKTVIHALLFLMPSGTQTCAAVAGMSLASSRAFSLTSREFSSSRAALAFSLLLT